MQEIDAGAFLLPYWRARSAPGLLSEEGEVVLTV